MRDIRPTNFSFSVLSATVSPRLIHFAFAFFNFVVSVYYLISLTPVCAFRSFVRLSVRPSVRLFVRPTVRPSIRPFVRSSFLKFFISGFFFRRRIFLVCLIHLNLHDPRDERFRSVALSLLRINPEQTFHIEYPGINGSNFNGGFFFNENFELETRKHGRGFHFSQFFETPHCISIIKSCVKSRVESTFI